MGGFEVEGGREGLVGRGDRHRVPLKIYRPRAVTACMAPGECRLLVYGTV